MNKLIAQSSISLALLVTLAFIALTFAPHADADTITVSKARIGCLDIQIDGNLTGLVGQACNNKTSCSYKAPTPAAYGAAGVKANTRLFCTQGMEITYHCGQNSNQIVTVPGDAWNNPPAQLICGGTIANTPPDTVPLTGFVDLHTHPLANLGFGGKLIYGGVDVGALLPADPDCQHNVRATSEQQALGHDKSTHGGHDFFSNTCGDEIRKLLIHNLQSKLGGADESEDASGYVGQTGKPDFPEWPVWNDLTHQKMWVEWIRRAYTGGLRVMVALAVNNKTLGDMTAGPGDYPTDDKSSADLQIDEIKSFVGRHPDFMEVAYSSADVYRIVSANKLAVIIGIEVDHIGNLQVAIAPMIPNLGPPSDAVVKAEIDRLYGEGVRYIFPIHVLDNAFGGSAAYVNLFNVSNAREDGHPYALVCANPAEDITDSKPGCKACGFTYDNGGIGDILSTTLLQLGKTGFAVSVLPSPQCPPGIGQKNSLPLTASGKVAIHEMMKLGMLIDIDHMSQAAADATLAIATPLGYPINSGHNGLRGSLSDNHNERALRADQYKTIGTLHGMAGVGSANLDAQQWLNLYNQVKTATVGTGGGSFVGAFGTDTDGFALGMPPRLGDGYKQCLMACLKVFINPMVFNACITSCRKQFPGSVQYSSAFPPSKDGNKTWNYNFDGVAHYGMLWDFLQDVNSLPGGADVVAGFKTGADYLYRTWKIAEAKGAAIPSVTLPPSPIVTPPPHPIVTPPPHPIVTPPPPKCKPGFRNCGDVCVKPPAVCP